MTDRLRPLTEGELADIVAGASAPFEVMGTGTKRGLGRPVQAAQTLDLSGFDAVHAYEPEELILEAGAGTLLGVIEKLIDARGQQLAFEPPDYSRLMGSTHSGTLGGMLACNLAGPRRIKSGAARDHVLVEQERVPLGRRRDFGDQGVPAGALRRDRLRAQLDRRRAGL